MWGMGLKISTEQESGMCWWGRVRLEQELCCLNVNELRDASRSCNLWTSATITVNCSKTQTWKREREIERDNMLCMCAQMTERGGKGGNRNIISQTSFMLSDSSGHCCKRSTSIVLTVTSLCKNDLHLSYLRSSGIVEGGSRPCSSKSFGSDALLVAAHALGW